MRGSIDSARKDRRNYPTEQTCGPVLFTLPASEISLRHHDRPVSGTEAMAGDFVGYSLYVAAQIPATCARVKRRDRLSRLRRRLLQRDFARRLVPTLSCLT